MRLIRLIGIVVFASLLVSCAGPTPAPQPTADVGAIVAQTMAALTANAPASTPTPSRLPRSLYFLNTDAAAHLQIFRLERDGETVTQITAEPADVESFDVNQNDGRVVYISNNQMLLVNADGSGRQILLDGGVKDVNNPFLNSIQTAVWSPDGQTIAYGFGGLNFYAVATGISNRVLENQIRDVDNQFKFPEELYWPDHFSPDGTKLAITLGYYEGAGLAIYHPAGNSLVRLTGDEGALICCGEEVWTADSSALYAANPAMGMFNSGLWRVDAASGQTTTLLPGDAGNGTFNFADNPLLAPDGWLYFFFASRPASDEFGGRESLQLVRAAADGVAGRAVLLPDIFDKMNEALWSPDASFVIVVSATNDQMYQGGQAEIVYLDGRPRVMLAPFARDLKWGPQ
jgi:Tol biopolymer transport system component